jgi:hypothetical protein
LSIVDKIALYQLRTSLLVIFISLQYYCMMNDSQILKTEHKNYQLLNRNGCVNNANKMCLTVLDYKIVILQTNVLSVENTREKHAIHSLNQQPCMVLLYIWSLRFDKNTCRHSVIPVQSIIMMYASLIEQDTEHYSRCARVSTTQLSMDHVHDVIMAIT